MSQLKVVVEIETKIDDAHEDDEKQRKDDGELYYGRAPLPPLIERPVMPAVFHIRITLESGFRRYPAQGITSTADCNRPSTLMPTAVTARTITAANREAMIAYSAAVAPR